MSNKYNGWTNWETWNANLWIENDWRLAESYHWMAGDLLGSYEQDEATVRLAKIIENHFRDICPEVEGFFSDMIDGAMREVNWREIAGHFVAEMIEEA
jgi:hypothetical protein